MMGLVALVSVVSAAGCATSSQLTSGDDVSSGPDPSGTVFGSTVAQGAGESRSEALTRLDAVYGPVPLVRVYAAGLPPSWDTLGQSLDDTQGVVSFKAHPSAVLSGETDDRLRRWFAEAPEDRDTYWVYFHEPENNVESGQFTAAEFRAAWEHIAALAAEQDNERLHATVVLMCYTVDPASGRDWHDYVPDSDSLEVLAWDCYNHRSDQGAYTPPDLLLDRAVRTADDRGVDWAVAELGARLATGDEGTGRAQWLEAVGSYAIRREARFVTYFDSTVGADFRLKDEPSIQAWRALVTR